MGGIVDSGSVEKDEGLIGSATADIQARGEIGRGFHTGKQLHRTEHIGLKHGRYLLDETGLYLSHPEISGFLAFALRFDDHFLQAEILRFQGHIQSQGLPIRQSDGDVFGFIADETEFKDIGPGFESHEAIESGGVGRGACGGPFDDDVGEKKSFSVVLIGDITDHGSASLGGDQSGKEQDGD